MGCTFKLVLKDSNITEEFRVARQDGDMHTVANNQREAYGSAVCLSWTGREMEWREISLLTSLRVC